MLPLLFSDWCCLVLLGPRSGPASPRCHRQNCYPRLTPLPADDERPGAGLSRPGHEQAALGAGRCVLARLFPPPLWLARSASAVQSAAHVPCPLFRLHRTLLFLPLFVCCPRALARAVSSSPRRLVSPSLSSAHAHPPPPPPPPPSQASPARARRPNFSTPSPLCTPSSTWTCPLRQSSSACRSGSCTRPRGASTTSLSTRPRRM